eukprot:9506055-Ditylum_brightwellii.AAC.1
MMEYCDKVKHIIGKTEDKNDGSLLKCSTTNPEEQEQDKIDGVQNKIINITTISSNEDEEDDEHEENT